MADQADDLGIPNTLVRPASRAAEPRTTTSPHSAGSAAAPTAPMPHLPGPTAQTPVSSRQRADQRVGSMGDVIEARKLVVGQGISLSGEIISCDRLVVEGRIQANLQKCQHMTIAETGLFDGNAAIRIPIVLFGAAYWDEIINFEALVRYGTITAAILNCFTALTRSMRCTR